MLGNLTLEQLQDEQIRRQLLEEYVQQDSRYPDSDTVQALKRELYRRGYKRSEIVKIALASIIRVQQSGN